MNALERVRAAALRLPDSNERLSHGMPTFFIRDKKSFAMFADLYHADLRTTLWLAGPPGAQEALGSRGWIGLVLDARTDWKDVELLLGEAYAHVAPQTSAALLDVRETRV